MAHQQQESLRSCKFPAGGLNAGYTYVQRTCPCCADRHIVSCHLDRLQEGLGRIQLLQEMVEELPAFIKALADGVGLDFTTYKGSVIFGSMRTAYRITIEAFLAIRGMWRRQPHEDPETLVTLARLLWVAVSERVDNCDDIIFVGFPWRSCALLADGAVAAALDAVRVPGLDFAP